MWATKGLLVLNCHNVEAVAAATHWTEKELWARLWEAQRKHEVVLFHVTSIEDDDETHIERGEN